MTTRASNATDVINVKDDNIFGTVASALAAPFSSNCSDSTILRTSVGLYAGIGVLAGGFFGRKRAQEGKPAIMGFVL